MNINGKTQIAMKFLKKFSPNHLIALTAISNGKTKTRSFNFKDEESKCREFIEEHNEKANLYFSVNPPRHKLTKKASKKDIQCVRYLHVDIDPRCGFPLVEEQERIYKRIKEFNPTPTIIIFSGGGYQCLWGLAEEIPMRNIKDIEEIESYNRSLAQQLGGDNCHNIDRILRLPGTVNIPDANKLRKGRKSALAHFEE